MALVNVEIEETLFVELGNLYMQKVLSEQYEGFKNGLTSNTFFVNDNARKSDFAALCDKYGSDKGSVFPESSNHPYAWKPHTYADFYSLLFGHCRTSMERVFECGIGTNNTNIESNMSANGKPGASLRVWRDYFPNAEIVAGDIDRDILFTEDRIKCFWIDQLNPAIIKAFWEQVGDGDFDLMLDDGLHKFEAGATLFENSIHRLKQHGVYIIEDVTVGDLLRYKMYFENKPYSIMYVAAQRSGELVSDADAWCKMEDNNLIVIKKT